MWTQLAVSCGSLVGRRGYPDCTGTTHSYPWCPDVYQPLTSTNVGAGTAAAKTWGQKGGPLKRQRQGHSSLPALLIGHIRLSSIHGEGLGVAAVLFHQFRAGVWKPDPLGSGQGRAGQGQGQGAESQKWKGPVDNRPVRQVSLCPSSQAMTSTPSAL